LRPKRKRKSIGIKRDKYNVHGFVLKKREGCTWCPKDAFAFTFSLLLSRPFSKQKIGPK
jgi:hypothetical protein